MKKPVKVAKQASQGLSQMAEDLGTLYKPNAAQRRAKANFWTAWQDDPSVDIELLTKDDAIQLSGVKTVGSWWAQAGFKDWFLNKDDHRQRLEYLYDLALDRAEAILESDEPKMASAQVNVIKAVAELGAKFPTANQGVTGELGSWLKAIGQMDAVQLRALFEKQGAKAGLILEKGAPQELSAPEDEKVLDNDDGV